MAVAKRCNLGETPDDNFWCLRRGTRTQTVEVRRRYIAIHASARLEAAQQGFASPSASVTDQATVDWFLLLL